MGKIRAGTFRRRKRGTSRKRIPIPAGPPSRNETCRLEQARNGTESKKKESCDDELLDRLEEELPDLDELMESSEIEEEGEEAENAEAEN